jgi:hypothetical protein
MLAFAFGHILHYAESVDIAVVALHQVELLFEADGGGPFGGDGPVTGLGGQYVLIELFDELFSACRFQELPGLGEHVFFCPKVEQLRVVDFSVRPPFPHRDRAAPDKSIEIAYYDILGQVAFEIAISFVGQCVE